jgi:hypothetical protein
MVYAGVPLMRSHVSRLDGLASVRRSYTPKEILQILASVTAEISGTKIDVFRRPLFRMGVVVWKVKG